MHRRGRIIWGSIIGGLLVLAGAAVFLQWKGWVPAWCLVPVVLSETLGGWLLVVTLRRNARFAREGRRERWVVRFGVAVFLILFGVALALAAFAVIPSPYSPWWPVGVLMVSFGATFIYRALVLPNSEEADES